MIKCPFDTSKVFCRKLLAPTTKICDTIGDVLFDNKTCAVDITNLDPKRTPIGVVFDVSKKLAVALDYAHHDWTQNGSSFATSDIPELPNYTGDNLINDYNGKSNTSIIIAYGDSNGYETAAADYCYNYSTLGTKKGDWYLPATGEVQLIYNNHAIINSTLSKIGAVIISYDYYWTSTEYDQKNAWRLDFSDGGFDEYPKYYSNKVRPILAFQKG